MTRVRPVAALPIAARYRAIDVALSNVSHAGIKSVAMFIGGSGRSIYDHIRSGSAWDLESRLSGGIFTYSQTYLKQRMGDEGFDENDFYVNHREFLKKSRTEYVLVTGGRMIVNLDILDLRNYHVDHDADMTIAYKKVPVDKVKGHPYEKVVKLDRDEDVVGFVSSDEADFVEETTNQFLNIYFLSVKQMLEILKRATKEGIHMDVDRLLAYYSQFHQVKAYEYTGPLMNLDSILAYYEANMALLDKQNYADFFLSEHNIITKAKNEPPTYYSSSANVKGSLFATGCYIDGTIENSVVFRKVTVAKDAEVRHSVLMQGATICEGAVVEYCILDKNITVEPGVVVRGTKDNPIILEKNETVATSR